MTCQLALSNKASSVMFSDSQVSTRKMEYHGFQKQFVGDDFLLGAAGHRSVIRGVFNSLVDHSSGDYVVKASTVAEHIVEYLHTEVTSQAAAMTSYILVNPYSDTQNLIQLFQPSIFESFVSEGNYATLGSGAEFVQGALDRDKELGLHLEPEDLVDLVVAAENYLAVASQSLTVDTQLTVGILRSKRAYLMGDANINVLHAPHPVAEKWNQVAIRYKRIMAQAQQIRGEIRSAQRALSSIQTAQLDHEAIREITTNQDSVSVNREQLREQIDDFCDWYDGLLDR